MKRTIRPNVLAALVSFTLIIGGAFTLAALGKFSPEMSNLVIAGLAILGQVFQLLLKHEAEQTAAENGHEK